VECPTQQFIHHSIKSRGCFNAAETHKIFSNPGCEVRATSASMGWRNLFVSVQREPVSETSYGGTPHHLLVVQQTGPVKLTLGMSGRPTTKTVISGGCTLIPGGEGFSIRITGAVDSVHVYLRKELVDRVLVDRACASSSPRQLTPSLGTPEPLLEHLTAGCVTALQRGDASSSLYVDHLAWAMAAHLVEAHAKGSRLRDMDVGKTLSERQLQRVRSYIEANLQRDISVEDLAQAAGLSPVYFARQFKRRTGVAPYRCVLIARVEQAKLQLSKDRMSITEIALACGFSHQEHLTHAFKTLCGTSPGAFRRNSQRS